MKLLDLSRLDAYSHYSNKKTKREDSEERKEYSKTKKEIFKTKAKAQENSDEKKEKKSKVDRLQKIIASAGICSRRKAEELILGGQVKVNGKKELKLGAKANPYTDIITVKEKALPAPDHKQNVYFLFNKPRACVSTVHDPQGRPTVMDYLKEIPERIFPVGRLDYASEGLLLFTNDGDMAHKIMHPSYQVKRSYTVKLRKRMSKKDMEELQNGIRLREGLVKPLRVHRGKPLKDGEWIHLDLKEGQNLVVRRLFKLLGYETDRLRRIAIGSLHIQNLSVGKFCQLRKAEVLSVLRIKSDKDVESKKKKKLIPRRSSRGPGKS